MFGWLKSLFGSDPVQEVVVPPLPPKVKKISKKAEKTASKSVAKKAAPKSKPAKAPVKKKEVTPVVEVQPVVESKVLEAAPKKKGGRPKKNDNKVG